MAIPTEDRAADPPVMFTRLFAMLRARGFEVGAEEYLRAHKSLEAFLGPSTRGGLNT